MAWHNPRLMRAPRGRAPKLCVSYTAPKLSSDLRIDVGSALELENSICGTGIQPVQAVRDQMKSLFSVIIFVRASHTRVTNPCHNERFSSSSATNGSRDF